MSIDPDAPEPVGDGRRRPPSAPDAKDLAGSPSATPTAAPDPAADVTSEFPPEPTAEVALASASAPAPAPEAEATPDPVAPSPERATGPSGRARSASPGRGAGATRSRGTSRRSPHADVGWETAIDDPAVATGGNGYRSFYVSDEVFARFRAAIYWTARRPDAENVPDNMSVGVEDYMESLATDLERRFNARAVFPPTPDQIRSHRKRTAR